jgi:hypothetical protein
MTSCWSLLRREMRRPQSPSGREQPAHARQHRRVYANDFNRSEGAPAVTNLAEAVFKTANDGKQEVGRGIRDGGMTWAVVAMLALAGPRTVRAANCGDVIDTNTTLDADVGPCDSSTDPALTVQGPATLDLNGHSILCTGDPLPDGVHLTGQAVKLRNGTVHGCHDGVVLLGTGRHRVQRIFSTQSSARGFLSK